MPAGAPSKYDPSFCDVVIEFGKQGKSVTYMAALLDVAKSTIYEWEKVYPEFSDALTRARQWAQVWWEDHGQIGMTADKFNAAVWSRSMAARFPDDWREVKARDHTSSDGSMTPPKQINIVSPN